MTDPKTAHERAVRTAWGDTDDPIIDYCELDAVITTYLSAMKAEGWELASPEQLKRMSEKLDRMMSNLGIAAPSAQEEE